MKEGQGGVIAGPRGMFPRQKRLLSRCKNQVEEAEDKKEKRGNRFEQVSAGVGLGWAGEPLQWEEGEGRRDGPWRHTHLQVWQ